jgi:myo-inositol-1(or 4)-monophosphatase
MTASDLELIEHAALAAGELALKFKREGQVKTWSKPGGSPVTNADLAVDDLLKRRLTAARPDYAWLSEETADDAARLQARRVFVVDPIDGTIAYIKDRPHWAVSIAVVEDGQPVAGVLHAPALDETYLAEVGSGARRNGQAIRVSGRAALEGAALLSDLKMIRHPGWPAPWPEDLRVETRNSVAYRMALVAAGQFDAVLAMSSKCDWDLAAADLIVREAGGLSTDHLGRPFAYNLASTRKPSLVSAGPRLHELIIGRVNHIELK